MVQPAHKSNMYDIRSLPPQLCTTVSVRIVVQTSTKSNSHKCEILAQSWGYKYMPLTETNHDLRWNNCFLTWILPMISTLKNATTNPFCSSTIKWIQWILLYCVGSFEMAMFPIKYKFKALLPTNKKSCAIYDLYPNSAPVFLSELWFKPQKCLPKV